MKKGLAVILVCAMSAALLAGSANAAEADKFPEQDITLMIGFAAGAGADVTSRAIMPYVETVLGKKIIIDYNPGAGGEVSFTQLALNTEGDGYNWTWICTPHLTVYPIARDTCEYTLDQIQAVCQISYDPCAFVVTKDSPFNNLADLIEYAKTNPGKVTIGNGGTGGDDFIANLKFMQSAGVELIQVPYANGAAEEITGLLGGHVDVATFNVSEYAQFEGLKLLGVMHEERVDIIPDVPTFKEQGHDIVMSADRGFAVPAGTDKDIVNKIANAVKSALDTPEFQEKAKSLSLFLEYKDPDGFQKYLENYAKNMQVLYDSNPW